MKTNISLLLAFNCMFALSLNAQNTKYSNTSFPDEEIAFYMKDGVKMSAKNHTPLLLSGLHDEAIGSTGAKMALNWAEANKTLLGLSSTFDLVPYFEHQGPSGQTIRLQQELNGVAVYKSEVVVHISPKNEVTFVTNTYDPSVSTISVVPTITAENAIATAKSNINVQGEGGFQKHDLIIYNRLDETKLVYKIVLEPGMPLGSWEILIDAQTGDVLRTADRACNHSGEPKTDGALLLPPPPPANGIGNVFLPDPLSVAMVSYAAPYNDNNDATNASMDATMSSVVLLDLNFTGSEYQLIGPYAEIVDFESPFNGLFSQASSTFNFNRNQNGFEAVNCYYHLDNSLRYINETLLTTCMPYQYSGGVQYDPSGLSGSDNSYYTAGSGRLSFGEGGVDDAEDADVVLHELGHGIHDWLTGGNLSQVNGLSEGSGDYWATSYSRSLNQWTSADPEYNWMFNWDGHNEWWSGRITNYTALYPGGLTGQIHTDGQIWATSLMRIYDQIGRTNLDKAFVEGLAMTGSSTNQEDAAIAVRQAAIDMNYSCADIDVMTTEFTATGYDMPALAQNTSYETSTICPGQSITVNGTVYNSSNQIGTEVIVGGGANGCDSIIYVDLNVINVNAGVTLNSNIFTSNQGNATYQWIDCDNGNAPIAGATNQSFTATAVGNYAVQVTFNGCTTTSACTLFDDAGLNDLENDFISVYPNPSNGIFMVVLNSNETEFNYEITSVDGRIVRNASNVSGTTFEVNLSNESSGVYFLRINNNSKVIQLVLETK